MPASLTQNYSLCSSVDVALGPQPPPVLIASQATEGVGRKLVNSAECRTMYASSKSSLRKIPFTFVFLAGYA